MKNVQSRTNDTCFTGTTLDIHHISLTYSKWETGGDLKGVHIPPGWEGLMLMYSRLTLVSTQPGGRPTIVFSGNVSLTWQHYQGHATEEEDSKCVHW